MEVELVQVRIKLRRDNLVEKNVPSRESPAGTCKGKTKEREKKIVSALHSAGHASKGKRGEKEKL